VSNGAFASAISRCRARSHSSQVRAVRSGYASQLGVVPLPAIRIEPPRLRIASPRPRVLSCVPPSGLGGLSPEGLLGPWVVPPVSALLLSKSLTRPLTVGSVAFEKAGPTPSHDPASARSNRSECTTSGGGQVQARAPPGAGARCQRMLAHIDDGVRCNCPPQTDRPGPR